MQHPHERQVEIVPGNGDHLRVGERATCVAGFFEKLSPGHEDRIGAARLFQRPLQGWHRQKDVVGQLLTRREAETPDATVGQNCRDRQAQGAHVVGLASHDRLIGNERIGLEPDQQGVARLGSDFPRQRFVQDELAALG